MNSPFFANPKIAHLLPPEVAHRAAIKALGAGLFRSQQKIHTSLSQEIVGLTFQNPVGIAAGFDKDAEVPEHILGAGFGFAEIGTITPRPQPGNPKPRVFRIKEKNALINRLGFNNGGHDAAFERLSRLRNSSKSLSGPVGINIGANKDTEDFVADYVLGLKRFAPLADYFTLNISSPNTPGLRKLQHGEALKSLFDRISEARTALETQPPVFLKIAPDLDDAMIEDICGAFNGSGFEGLIVSNTTLARDAVAGLTHADEAGGLSGMPLAHPSTIVLAKVRQYVGDQPILIGVGGVHDTHSAIGKFEAGANLIQLYTALIYEGFGLADRINHGLADYLSKENHGSVADIVGKRTSFWAGGGV